MPSPTNQRAFTGGQVTVATSSTAVLALNQARTRLQIQNISANQVDFAVNTTDGSTAPTAVAATSAVRLVAGATWTNVGYKGPVAAIAQTGASQICVLET